MATGTGAGTGFDGDDLLIWIIPAHQFSRDSLLEEGVSSEPVSEWGSSAAGNNGTIPRRLWMIIEAEKGHFGLEYAGIWVFALRQLLLLPSS